MPAATSATRPPTINAPSGPPAVLPPPASGAPVGITVPDVLGDDDSEGDTTGDDDSEGDTGWLIDGEVGPTAYRPHPIEEKGLAQRF